MVDLIFFQSEGIVAIASPAYQYQRLFALSLALSNGILRRDSSSSSVGYDSSISSAPESLSFSKELKIMCQVKIILAIISMS